MVDTSSPVEGALYPTKDDLRLSVLIWTRENMYLAPKVSVSDTTRITMLCPSNCDFKAIGRRVNGTGQWKITQWIPHHNTECQTTAANVLIPTKIVANSVSSNSFQAARRAQILQHCANVLEYQPPKHQLKRLVAQLDTHSEPAEVAQAYRRISSILDAIKTANPSSTVSVLRDTRTKAFKHLFVCLGAYKRLFEVCPKVLTLDAAHMKTNMRGNLFLCMQMDANHHYFPIAFGVHCGNEDRESWTWFLQQLHDALASIDQSVVFVSDRDKGLSHAVPAIFPHSLHRYCWNHLQKNMDTNRFAVAFKNAMFGLRNTQDTGRALQKQQELLKNSQEREKRWLLDLPLPNFVKAYTTSKTFNTWTNNLAESANATFKAFRELQIDELVKSIFFWCLSKYADYAADTASECQKGTRWIAFALRHVQEMRQLVPAIAIQRGPTSYVATYKNFSATVHFDRIGNAIQNFRCSCAFTDDTGLPCCHICSVAADLQVDLLSQLDPIYSMEEYSKVWTYDNALVVADFSESIVEDDTETPFVPRPRGRPKKLRAKGFLERISSGSKSASSSDEGSVRCSSCRQIGHNKKTCKQPIASSSQQR